MRRLQNEVYPASSTCAGAVNLWSLDTLLDVSFKIRPWNVSRSVGLALESVPTISAMIFASQPDLISTGYTIRMRSIDAATIGDVGRMASDFCDLAVAMARDPGIVRAIIKADR